MKKISILLCIVGLFINMSFAQSRKPAVDPIVEVEPKSVELIKKAKPSPVNFNITSSTAQVAKSATDSGIFVYFVLIAFISLPLASWLIIERTSRTSRSNKMLPEEKDDINSISDLKEQSKSDDINKAS